MITMISVATLLLSIKNIQTKSKLIEMLKKHDANHYNYGLLHDKDSFKLVKIY